MPVRKIEAVISVKTIGSGELVKIRKEFNQLGGTVALKTVKQIQKFTKETRILQGAVQKANPEVVRLTKKFNQLGGQAALDATREVNKLKRGIKTLTPAVKKANTIWTKFTKGIAIGNIAAHAAVGAFNLLKKSVGDATRELADATKVAARIEVLNGVMQFTGKQAGFSARQLEANRRAIVGLGITQQGALSIQQRFIQGNLDIANAVDIARVAQNAAVIAGTDSSDAALQITDAILKQRPILLKQFGIITNLTDIYGKQAEALGKSRTELTQLEKRQAFFNDIMEKSSTITGAYTTAMDFAGKRLTSLPRHFEAAQQAVGRHFLPAFNTAITATENLLKGIKAAFGDPLNAVAAAGEKFRETSAATLTLADRYDDLAGKAELTATEQDEINTILEKFESISPGVVTAWDDQGNAISINTTRLRENLKAQQASIDLDLQKVMKERGEAFRDMSKAVSETAAEITRLNEPIATVQQGFQRVEKGQAQSAVTLVTLKAEMREYVEETRLGLPLLVKGTDNYTFAVRSLGQEFVDLIVAAEAADVATKKVADVSAAPQVQTGIGYQGATVDLIAFNVKQQQERDKAAKAVERAAKEHSERMGLVRGLEFDASLVGLDEHHIAIKEAAFAHDQRMAELKEGNILSLAEFDQGRLASEALFQEELSFIQLDAVEATTQKYEERWAWATDATQEAFGELTRIAITDSKNIGREMETVFEDIGRSIVVNMAKKAVDALKKYIFQAVAAKAVSKLLGNEQESLGDKTEALANITGNLAGHTLSVATQTFLTVTAMKAEGLQVKTLIAQYIALAAAKSAVNPFSAPGRIAAAATVQTTLTPLLMTGFDDPQNDAVAFRHGADYASQFMRGLNTEWKAPDYGQTIRQNIPIGGGGDYARDNGYIPDGGFGPPQTPGVVLNIHGNVYSNDDLVQMIRDVQDGGFSGFNPSGVFQRGAW